LGTLVGINLTAAPVLPLEVSVGMVGVMVVTDVSVSVTVSVPDVVVNICVMVVVTGSVA
jgi:hypothetical protein